MRTCCCWENRRVSWSQCPGYRSHRESAENGCIYVLYCIGFNSFEELSVSTEMVVLLVFNWKALEVSHCENRYY